MYKVKPPTKQELDDFYDAYAPRIQTLMQEVANGNLTIPLTLGTSNKVQLTLKVQQGSTTWHFLTVYSQDANLKKLLCGKWQDHMSIINAIVQRLPGLSWQKRMLKTEYDAGAYTIYGQDADGYEIVENFNDIMYWIFVEQICEGNDNMVKFNKTDFVKKRGLMICPYCGRQWVDVAEEGVRVSKPNIDHFLPKSKYPFLAMSFFNMIPSCHSCNERENKGDMDPILYPGHELKLLNPYEFYDNAVTFSYKYNGQGENDVKNFSVQSVAENVQLEEGYLRKLKLRPFYENQRLEVKDIHRRFTKSTNSMKKFLYRLGINKTYLQNIEERTLGYMLNDDEASQRLLYKFKKDLLLQLRKEYGI